MTTARPLLKYDRLRRNSSQKHLLPTLTSTLSRPNSLVAV